MIALLLVLALGAKVPRGLPNTGDTCKDSCTLSQQVCEKQCASSAKESRTFDEKGCLAECGARFTPCLSGCRRMLPIAEEKMREQADGGATAP